jgi:hypothetical protein
MTRRTRGLVLALAIGTLAADLRGAEDKDVKKARKLILELAKESLAGKDISREVAAARKEVDDLEAWMHVYKPRGRSGSIGTDWTEGIEVQIIRLGKKPLAPTALAKHSDQLMQFAHINLVMAEVARSYASAARKPRNAKQLWDRHVQAQKRAAEELIRAVKAKNPTGLQKAATRLNAACNDCHSDFRD